MEKLKPLTADSVRNQLDMFTLVAYFRNRKGAEKESVWVDNVDGSEAIQLVRDERLNVEPRRTADGEHLIYGSSDYSHYDRSNLQYRRVSISGERPNTEDCGGRQFRFTTRRAPAFH